MMPLWTTYLARWAQHKGDILKVIGATSKRHSAAIYFVQRKRGNDEVAPSEELLKDWKSGKIDWLEYERRYLDQLSRGLPDLNDPDDWMYDRLIDLEDGGHALLICYEKSPEHCHRRLLAEEMKRRYPEIDYRGEVQLAAAVR